LSVDAGSISSTVVCAADAFIDVDVAGGPLKPAQCMHQCSKRCGDRLTMADIDACRRAIEGDYFASNPMCTPHQLRLWLEHDTIFDSRNSGSFGKPSIFKKV